MKTGKWRGSILGIMGLTAALMGTGCSEQVDDSVVDRVLPHLLSSMQGSWVSVTTNDCTASCGVTIEDYTIRLRFQETLDSPMVRHSAMIETIDEQRQLLILAGESGAWPFSYGIQDGEELLEVEFFNEQSQEWKRMHLGRSEKIDV